MKSLLLPLLLLAVTIATAPHATAAAVTRKALVGGWSPISDPSDPHVKDIAVFAVTEHNKQTNSGLVFVKVVSGQTQVVAGISYKLVIQATNGGAAGRYEAVVWEKEGQIIRELTSFKPVNA